MGMCGRNLSSCIKVSGVVFVETCSQWHGVAKGVKDFAQNSWWTAIMENPAATILSTMINLDGKSIWRNCRAWIRG